MLSVLLPSAVASVILMFRLRSEVVRSKTVQNMFAIVLPMALRTFGTLVLMAVCLVNVENLDGLAFVAGLLVTVNVPLLLQLWKIT